MFLGNLCRRVNCNIPLFGTNKRQVIKRTNVLVIPVKGLTCVTYKSTLPLDSTKRIMRIEQGGVVSVDVLKVPEVPELVVGESAFLPLFGEIVVDAQMETQNYRSDGRRRDTSIRQVDQMALRDPFLPAVASIFFGRRRLVGDPQQIVVHLLSPNHHGKEFRKVEVSGEDEVVLQVTVSTLPYSRMRMTQLSRLLRHLPELRHVGRKRGRLDETITHDLLNSSGDFVLPSAILNTPTRLLMFPRSAFRLHSSRY